ncbi:hypothetical protein [Stutzerimonas stutzeri]|uniref:Uncharacterized protein n=1 Tax=Stutzerimonas stutzeri TaxID=316 RepID=A0AA40V7F9_STUST|nr:hypothetical protein [Stutzerimonas stutzeri]MBA1306728.1 hypothetical protein [Stutzerimonas stutzeri]
MRKHLALLLATLAGFLVVVVGIAVLDSSTAFWLKLPSWAPILPMACYVGAVMWATSRVIFGVHRRVAGR